MGLSGARKLLLILVVTAFVFSGTAEAWSWSWGSDQSSSNWGWGWGSDNSGGGSGSGGSDSNSGGSSWGWGWSSNGTNTNWGWGSSNGSSGTGSTHNGHSSGSNHSRSTGTRHNHTAPISHRRKIEVTVWKSGFNYTTWASNHAPFYVKDVLDFKYNNDQTQSKTKHSNNKSNKNNVYLLPDLRSYKSCDVSIGKKLVARGGSSSGFKLFLRKAQTYYFASEDHNGCNHNMKFSVHPIPHPSSH
ncbi:hypothetical protein V5N11_024348 [Cardamine amara subsp. amara]|uniref:Phytocyanin domain-containing protein n=1 Tax=Cardamine amara subsp. amara TaxID=228776 RepID=A0ABD1BIJ0_CARAN